MDYTHDEMAGGRKFRTLNLMDGFTREALWIEPDTSLPGLRVVRVLEGLRERRGTPAAIQVDNGTEFTSRVVDQWAYQNQVALQFIERGKPTQNAFIESFNGKFRDECLNQNWFVDLRHARKVIEDWRVDYNTVRPHSSLRYLTAGRVRGECCRATGVSPHASRFHHPGAGSFRYARTPKC
jgi:putative transposase